MFDGNDKSKFETWCDTLDNYVWAYASEFNTEKKKIAFTVSLLGREDGARCPASNWVRNWKKKARREIAFEENCNSQEFMEDLAETFADGNGTQTAHMRLTTTYIALNAEKFLDHEWVDIGSLKQYIQHITQNSGPSACMSRPFALSGSGSIASTRLSAVSDAVRVKIEATPPLVTPASASLGVKAETQAISIHITPEDSPPPCECSRPPRRPPHVGAALVSRQYCVFEVRYIQ
ncbi:hypothetical protein B0H10DRAFT_2219958 [Mycena sp. CBHHK59/15]|nr:hypothetical protein B0H10DRAFT_2219958 [Mycena sp. CBHHK59/15]